MRLTHLVSSGGCASKLGPNQLGEIIGKFPKSMNPSVLVGFDTRDDAGVFLLPDGSALVQTIDFFTPIVDDPYAYGQIAAANALSDVYAMGGRPISTLSVACFSPSLAPAEVWAAILQGAYDKTLEAGAVILGGHTVDDKEPKFGMAVTGLVDPKRMFVNTEAKLGDRIYLTKPLGTGIITSAAKSDAASDEQILAAITSMSRLNRDAMELGLTHKVRCATDITGFGLGGHLFNVARASHVRIQIQTDTLPLLPGVRKLVEKGFVTGGGKRNREFLGDRYSWSVDPWMMDLVFDPQTSGGLVLFSPETIEGATEIGEVISTRDFGLEIR